MFAAADRRVTVNKGCPARRGDFTRRETAQGRHEQILCASRALSTSPHPESANPPRRGRPPEAGRRSRLSKYVATACPRLATPNLCRIRLTCDFTVSSDRNNPAAISRLLAPLVISCRTSYSRRVRSETSSLLLCHGVIGAGSADPSSGISALRPP